MTLADQLARRIAAEQERTRARVESLEREFANIVEASADAVRDDEHDPEGATIAFERAQVAALIADAHRRLAALDAAAARVPTGEGVTCAGCGRPVGFERLMARPGATHCVACADRSSSTDRRA